MFVTVGTSLWRRYAMGKNREDVFERRKAFPLYGMWAAWMWVARADGG